MKMKSMRLIALLLDYPEEKLWGKPAELTMAVDLCLELRPSHSLIIKDFIEQMSSKPLMDIQSEYCDLFDRGRSLSLLLFEHVHGESRDRGQAMIDLINQYSKSNMEINCKQLPDYLPVYLEYLSQTEEADAINGLKDIAPILALLKERLNLRDSLYSGLFEILITLSGENILQDVISERVSQETKDDTPQALDAVWEEEQVKFLGEEGCASAQQAQHQRRFAKTVIPQFLDINAVSGVK